jgi:hypothetical protein
MRLKLLFFLFFSFQLLIFSQYKQLSPSAEISVLTIGQGNSLNDAFGHNVFRVKDKTYGIDLVYGYGEYDYDAPNFYLNFAQGKLNYLISSDSYQRFYRRYVNENRTIREQVLNLTLAEKQNIFDYLQYNLKPENRRYLYDFFYDNCATKMRDIVEETSTRKITFNTPANFKPKTFRELIGENVDANSWESLGMDIAIGSVTDKQATPYEHMFLPKYIFDFFESATINSTEKLVKKTNTLYQKKNISNSKNFLLSPLGIFGILGVIIIFITYFDFKKQKRNKWLDLVLFVFTGFIGVGLLLLWFATDHSSTAQNYNLLWAFPLNIFVIAQLFKNKVKSWFVKYLKFLIIMLCLLTLHWIIGIQAYAIGLIPLLIALFIRHIYLATYFNKSLK